MPGGLDGAAFRALAVINENAGPVLYGVGRIPGAGVLRGVARWDGRRGRSTARSPWVELRDNRHLQMNPGLSVYIGGQLSPTWRHRQREYRASWPVRAGFRIGDLNCDGVVDGFDIDPFVAALVSPAQYAQSHPDCFLEAADCNSDGRADVFDIDPFVEILLGQRNDADLM